MISMYEEYTDLMLEDWRLPGKWYSLEQEFNSKYQRTSYVMDAWLHPDEHRYGYKDFWGVDQPNGHKIFITIVERPKRNATPRSTRWTVTTGRYTNSDMSTSHFNSLSEAMKFATNEMILTTKKYDRIHKTTTPIWDFKLIEKYDPSFNSVK